LRFFKPDKSDEQPRIMAAVDLGSNSFHMLVARVSENGLQVMDTLREMVRLGEGLDKNNDLSNESQQRALDCLQRFSQRLHNISPQNIRVVGTNTLREARNANSFLTRAQQVLGHPIEVIYGLEEARLIFLGVAHNLAEKNVKRLVIDIGGGSTEIITGENFTPTRLESLSMGCVTMRMKYFADGKITKNRLYDADIVARLELEGISQQFSETQWQQVVGASGTIRAIAKVMTAQGWSENGITKKSLKQLRKELLDAGHVDNLNLKGLSDERLPTLVGGYVILQALFNSFSIELMLVSGGAVREGLIYEMLGRLHQEDIREQTIDQLMKRYAIDIDHAHHVEQAVLQFLKQVATSWELENEDNASILSWAARLHELGITVAHAGYHKHGAYLTLNSDLPGFSLQEQQFIAVLIRSHRRKLSLSYFEILPKKKYRQAIYLSMLLRIAVIFHRSRTYIPCNDISLEAGENYLQIIFPAGWLDDHALTSADLHREVELLENSDYKLSFVEK